MKPAFLRTMLVLLATSLLGGGCGPQNSVPSPTPLPVPQGDVVFGSGRGVAPGATILVGGVEYTDNAPLPEQTLVGVIKDGQAYLYHPAMGDAELSKYNSRRAVGYFLADQAADANARPRAADKLRSRSLELGEQAELGTGVDVDCISYSYYQFENTKHRWVAIKAGGDEPTHFLWPSGGFFEPDIIGTFSDIVAGDFDESASGWVRVGSEDIETYGAMIRAVPLLGTPPLSYTLMQKAATAADHDAELFVRVNLVDWIHMEFECLNALLGFVPDCGELPIDTLISDAAELALMRVLTENDDWAREELCQVMAEEFTMEAAGCVCEFVSAGA